MLSGAADGVWHAPAPPRGSSSHAHGRAVALPTREGAIDLADDIVARLHADFGPASDGALDRLVVLRVPELQRVARCVLFLAGGDPDALRRWIEEAGLDYRDVLLAAEYEERPYGATTRLHHIRDFSKPFGTNQVGKRRPG